MSDDIPIIFAEELQHPGRKATAAFMSAASLSQMQQYAAGGWRVLVAPDFKSKGEIDLASVPAVVAAESDLADCTFLSCEVPFLGADAGARISAWKPAIVKFNCAFHDVADAGQLAASLAGMGYTVLGAHWRDDNSFSIRTLTQINHIAAFQPPEWDRTNVIGVRDPARARALLTVSRLYTGEEKRIGELRLANAIRNDHIARLEEALAAHQTAKLQQS